MNFIMFFLIVVFTNLCCSSWSQANGVKQSEIKWSICDRSSIEILTKFNLKIKKSKNRLVSYFDDRSLTLYKRGIQIRKRGTLDDFELTVKAQYQTEEEIPWDWISDKNHKCEQDIIDIRSILACSIDSKFDPSVFMDKSQFDLIADRSSDVNFKQLFEYGPVKNTIWKLVYEKGDMALEELELPYNINIHELSVRANREDIATIKSEIENRFLSLQINLCTEQKGKTIQVLKAFAN